MQIVTMLWLFVTVSRPLTLVSPFHHLLCARQQHELINLPTKIKAAMSVAVHIKCSSNNNLQPCSEKHQCLELNPDFNMLTQSQ